jgi:hypothetical protein
MWRRSNTHPEYGSLCLAAALRRFESYERQDISGAEGEGDFLEPACCSAVHAFTPKACLPFIPIARIRLHRGNQQPESHTADIQKGLYHELGIGQVKFYLGLCTLSAISSTLAEMLRYSISSSVLLIT